MRGVALALVIAAGAPAAAPPPGRYAATLCVTTAPGRPASCGAAEFELRSKTRALVRVADVVYRLHLRPDQVDIMTMQGTMEIDEFSAFYEWHGDVLSWLDPDKNVRYQVTPAPRTRGRR